MTGRTYGRNRHILGSLNKPSMAQCHATQAVQPPAANRDYQCDMIRESNCSDEWLGRRSTARRNSNRLVATFEVQGVPTQCDRISGRSAPVLKMYAVCSCSVRIAVRLACSVGAERSLPFGKTDARLAAGGPVTPCLAVRCHAVSTAMKTLPAPETDSRDGVAG